MSRTFKDRPEWVQRFDARHRRRVVHDHRAGCCHVETLADARRDASRDWGDIARSATGCRLVHPRPLDRAGPGLGP